MNAKSTKIKSEISARVCFLCKKPGHFIADCIHNPQRNVQNKKGEKNVSLTVKHDRIVNESNVSGPELSDSLELFKFDGWVSVNEESEKVPVRMLRDTGSSKSIVVRSRIPFIEEALTGNSVILRGLLREPLVAPLAKFYLRSGFASCYVEVAVIEELQV